MASDMPSGTEEGAMAERRQSDKETMTMKSVTLKQGERIGTCRRRSSLRVALALGALLLGLCLWAGPAQAYEGINIFRMGPSTTQAGGHPDIRIELEWDDSIKHEGNFSPPNNICGCDDARIISQHFPTGFIGNPHATSICELAEFSLGRCPASSQVGIAEPFAAGTGGGEFESFGFVPLYNMTPRPNESSLTALWVPLAAAPVFIHLSARTNSDYGLDAASSPVYHPLPQINALGITLWGVPASPVHDPQRFKPPLTGFGLCGLFGCSSETVGIGANEPEIPYLEGPTTCGVPLFATAEIEYYTHNTQTKTIPWPAATGCQQLTFNPSLSAQPTTGEADSASGVDVDLKVPQEQSPLTPAPSEIKALTTTLPAGFTINANAADGKVSCSDVDTAIGTLHGSTCPEFSKVGTLSLDSSALPSPIPGAIYIGDPKPGNRYRLILAADGFGTHVKLAGSVHPDPQTGQLQINFLDLPQSPLTEFAMHFFGSERGLLATPTQCGTLPVESEFVPWDNELPSQHSLTFLTIDGGPGGSACPNGPRPFSPTVNAGSANTRAGSHAPFTLQINRADGQQNLKTLSVSAPPGLSATLRGVPYCPESALNETADANHSGVAEQAAPKCPAASQIGTATVAAGAGTHPVYFPGKVYLAGPYKGAPLSLAVVTPAVEGPYDLGNVVVRSAVNVDPTTARISVASDPLPQILDGVPLRLRTIDIRLNREGFALNPTNCDPFAVETSIAGDEGAVSTPGAGFQVANCSDLAFGPKLGLRLSGGTKRRGHPALQAVLRTQPDEANISQVVTTLPKTEVLDNAHIKSPCTRVQYAQNACPAGSRLGSATAESPLLDQPLRGPVFLRSGSHKLPDLVIQLNGQVNIELLGRIDSSKAGGLRTSFETVPDVPVSSFVLNLEGGQKGLLQNGTNLCRSPGKAKIGMTGQNGAVTNIKKKLQVACGSTARHKRHHRRLMRARRVR
jgi:hypothetical protein